MKAWLNTSPRNLILDLCLKKLGRGIHMNIVMSPSSKSSVFTKCFLSPPKPTIVFKFLRFEDRFRKTMFSWLISVDCRLKEERKLRFQISQLGCVDGILIGSGTVCRQCPYYVEEDDMCREKKTLGDNKR